MLQGKLKHHKGGQGFEPSILSLKIGLLGCKIMLDSVNNYDK
jgi:hypothetical protein